MRELTTRLSELLKAPTVYSVNGANAVSRSNKYGKGYIMYGGNDRAIDLWLGLDKEKDIVLSLGFDPGEYTLNMYDVQVGISFYTQFTSITLKFMWRWWMPGTLSVEFFQPWEGLWAEGQLLSTQNCRRRKLQACEGGHCQLSEGSDSLFGDLEAIHQLTPATATARRKLEHSSDKPQYQVPLEKNVTSQVNYTDLTPSTPQPGKGVQISSTFIKSSTPCGERIALALMMCAWLTKTGNTSRRGQIQTLNFMLCRRGQPWATPLVWELEQSWRLLISRSLYSPGMAVGGCSLEPLWMRPSWAFVCLCSTTQCMELSTKAWDSIWLPICQKKTCTHLCQPSTSKQPPR